MRLHFSLLSLVFLCAGIGAAAQTAPATFSCGDLHLVPAPRECTSVAAIRVDESGVRVLAEHNAEDEFAAKDLEESLKSRDVRLSEHDAALIRLVRADTSVGREGLAHHQLKFDPAMHDEGYVIVPDGAHGVAVIAETAAGLFYGAQTVKQLIRGSGKGTVLLAPTLRDWPAMAHRGLSDDWSRGPLPNMDFVKREIRTLAAYKVNIFSPYFEATFAYPSSPVAAFPGGAMTPDEAREMVAYAAQYHITIIPEQEAFGHLHHVLKFEEYSSLGETPHGAVLAPGDPGTLPLISSWFGELAKVFPGPYAHIGADETEELGLGKTREEVKQKGLGAVYLNFLSQIHATLAPYHKQLLFWGDIAENSPELVGTLPKDMIAVPWHYDAAPDFTKNLEPFIKSGLETWVAPGVNNWNRVYPEQQRGAGQHSRVCARRPEAGREGHVEHGVERRWRGNLRRELVWRAVWRGSWMAAGRELGGRRSRHRMAWLSMETKQGKIDQAQQALMDAHDVLKKAGLEDAQDCVLLDRSVFARGAAGVCQAAARGIGVAPRCGEGHHAAGPGTRRGKTRKPGGAGRYGTGCAAHRLYRLQIPGSRGLHEPLQPGTGAGLGQEPVERGFGQAGDDWLEQWAARRHSRWLHAARPALPGSLAARQPGLLAGEQPGPLRSRSTTLDRTREPVGIGTPSVVGNAHAASRGTGWIAGGGSIRWKLERNQSWRALFGLVEGRRSLGVAST